MVDTFGQDLQPWHDFYTLMGSSAAALLGLLFVSASIHLDALPGNARALAHETFNQFFLLLELAAVCLVPGLTPATFGLAVLLVAYWEPARSWRRLWRRRLGFPHPWRRDVFPALAFVLLLVTGGAVWTTGAPIIRPSSPRVCCSSARRRRTRGKCSCILASRHARESPTLRPLPAFALAPRDRPEGSRVGNAKARGPHVRKVHLRWSPSRCSTEGLSRTC